MILTFFHWDVVDGSNLTHNHILARVWIKIQIKMPIFKATVDVFTFFVSFHHATVSSCGVVAILFHKCKFVACVVCQEGFV